MIKDARFLSFKNVSICPRYKAAGLGLMEAAGLGLMEAAGLGLIEAAGLRLTEAAGLRLTEAAGMGLFCSVSNALSPLETVTRKQAPKCMGTF